MTKTCHTFNILCNYKVAHDLPTSYELPTLHRHNGSCRAIRVWLGCGFKT